MAQPVVSTMITLDRERTLRFDWDAIDALSGLTTVDRGGERSPLDLWRLANGFDTKGMALMLWAGCKHEDSALTVDGTRRALRHALRQKVTTWKKLNDALNAALNQSESLGFFQATDDDEDDAGNAPAPPAKDGLSG